MTGLFRQDVFLQALEQQIVRVHDTGREFALSMINKGLNRHADSWRHADADAPSHRFVRLKPQLA
jgi:hypothetical protein